MAGRQNLKNIKETVRFILENDTRARNDDRYLYVRVCETFCPGSTNEPFALAYMNKSMPSSESVRRSRAWLQEHYETLRPNDTVSAFRRINEDEYREFVRDGRRMDQT